MVTKIEEFPRIPFPIDKVLFLGKEGRMALPNRMNFRKSSKGGGGVIFNSKICVAVFGNFEQAFLSMKLIQKSSFRVQGIFSTIVLRKIKKDTF